MIIAYSGFMLVARSLSLAALLTAAFAPCLASAHEVYVLTQEQIRTGMIAPPTSAISVILANTGSFMLAASLAVIVVVAIFFLSISRRLERLCDPFLEKIKHYAPAVARVTIGISLVAAAYFEALFGPELPLASLFGPYAMLVRAILAIAGILIVIGWHVRAAALAMLVLFAVAVSKQGTYMLTYANYLGEIIVLLLIGTHRLGIDRFRSSLSRSRHALEAVQDALAPFSFLFLRIAFGVSLIYASFYAKFLHNELAYEVATLPLAGHALGLSQYFGIEPHFLVLGAGIIELVIGMFFLLGIEIRFTALFVEFWLALSLVYFGETVWPHIVLIGIPIAFFMYGYDKYSLEGRFFKKPGREPVF